jgi:alkylation response protein AidB-like acyl-CoA dehydrogenase
MIRAATLARFYRSVCKVSYNERGIMSRAYDLAKKVMPKISNTEAAALEAGTVGFDGTIFEGTPNLNDLCSKYDVALRDDELRFMNEEVVELCEMLDDYQITRDRDLPVHVWDFMKEKRMFGMIIPEEYGGLGFSAHGHSQVVTKISTRSASAAVSVMVPNSLGPAELLMRYGTNDQKNFYLPRLARGTLIPCFALTGPASGSDAASMRDSGYVAERNGELGIVATFQKRYITLAPVAGVVGLALNVRDPDHLLRAQGNGGTEGISIALLQRDHPGLRIGDRHDPLNAAFMNGTVEGEDVWIPLSCLLGGPERAGFGWNMLMDCLAEGRGVSLPAMSVAAAKGVSSAVGAYARVRKQFKVPLAEMEGVQEPLARIASNALVMQSAQHFTNAMLNQHEQPAVISAIMKQQMTDRMRSVVNDGMDILGGAGICNGRSNFLANAYMQVCEHCRVDGQSSTPNSHSQSCPVRHQSSSASHVYSARIRTSL